MYKNPTDEQIGKFWEWCGFYEEDGMGVTDADSNIYYRHIYTPTGELIERYPPIDLNNLFKWAMPELDQAKYYHCLQSIFVKQKDPALALFWAIWQIIKEENG